MIVAQDDLEQERQVRRLEERLRRLTIVGTPETLVAGNLEQGYSVDTARKKAPIGACCIGPDCIVITERECTDAGGTYQGDWIDCDPTPCGACLACNESGITITPSDVQFDCCANNTDDGISFKFSDIAFNGNDFDLSFEASVIECFYESFEVYISAMQEDDFSDLDCVTPITSGAVFPAIYAGCTAGIFYVYLFQRGSYSIEGENVPVILFGGYATQTASPFTVPNLLTCGFHDLTNPFVDAIFGPVRAWSGTHDGSVLVTA